MADDYSMGAQLIAQLKAIGLTIVYSGIMTAVLFFVASIITGGGRVDEETEQIGLDEKIHGEKALNL